MATPNVRSVVTPHQLSEAMFYVSGHNFSTQEAYEIFGVFGKITSVSIKTHGMVLTFDGYTPLENFTALTINGTHVKIQNVSEHGWSDCESVDKVTHTGHSSSEDSSSISSRESVLPGGGNEHPNSPAGNQSCALSSTGGTELSPVRAEPRAEPRAETRAEPVLGASRSPGSGDSTPVTMDGLAGRLERVEGGLNLVQQEIRGLRVDMNRNSEQLMVAINNLAASIQQKHLERDREDDKDSGVGVDEDAAFVLYVHTSK